MSQQREENSVLFSLKELRRMEDDRLQKEEAEVKAQEEATRRAKEETERRARDEIERQRREVEDRVRRDEETRLAREREEQLRLQEAERRARVEGEMRLQEERMRLEVQSRKQSKPPVAAIATVIGVVVLGAGGIIWKLRADHVAELQAKEAERIRTEEDYKRREEETRLASERKVMQLSKQLDSAKTEEEKRHLQQEVERERERERQRQKAGPRAGRAPAAERPESAPSRPAPIKQRQLDDDPLKGLKL